MSFSRAFVRSRPDLPCTAGPHRAANRVARAMEDLTLNLRQQLLDYSDLGEFGAAAIRREPLIAHLEGWKLLLC